MPLFEKKAEICFTGTRGPEAPAQATGKKLRGGDVIALPARCQSATISRRRHRKKLIEIAPNRGGLSWQ
jgi:hypothetical protein